MRRADGLRKSRSVAPREARRNAVWYAWAAPDGALHQIGNLVATGDPASAPHLQDLLTEWRRVGTLNHITKTERILFGNVPDHKSRSDRRRPAELACSADRGRNTVGRGRRELVADSQQKRDWFGGQIEQLYHILEPTKEIADRELAELEQLVRDNVVGPAACTPSAWALRDLCELLGEPLHALNTPRRGLAFPAGIPEALEPGLRFRLLIVQIQP